MKYTAKEIIGMDYAITQLVMQKIEKTRGSMYGSKLLAAVNDETYSQRKTK